ncbi:MAG: hypothetical protein F6K21_16900 [Symploca sp. SIO2D2]|nr:hypothetical protein [Symploca sp. SIO2D2]
MKTRISWLLALVFSVMMLALPNQAIAAEVQQPIKAHLTLAQAPIFNVDVNTLPEVAETSLKAAEAAPKAVGNALYAVVNSNGSLDRGFGAVSSQKVDTPTGSYEVIFNRNVRTCAYVATTGLSGSVGTTPPGGISVVGRATSTNGVFISTTNMSGDSQDQPFHLVVQCP